MAKKKLTPDIRKAIVRDILNTRDFCGNERATMREWKREYDISEKAEFEIVEAVEFEWHEWQEAARA